MTKSRKQRRAEAIGRLKWAHEFDNEHLFDDLFGCDANKTYKGHQRACALIDLLSEDECEMVDMWEREDADGVIWSDGWQCTGCGAMVSGVMPEPSTMLPPKFCPNCRARVKAMYENLHGSDHDEQNRRSDDGESENHVTFDPQKVTFDDAPRLSDLYGIWREDGNQSQVPVPNETRNETRNETGSADTREDEDSVSERIRKACECLDPTRDHEYKVVHGDDFGNCAADAARQAAMSECADTDTREKLEADVREYCNVPECGEGTMGYSWYKAAMRFIDRQAEITERKWLGICDKMEEQYKARLHDMCHDTETTHVAEGEGAMSDTREKLEEEVWEWCKETAEFPESCERRIAEWLDRQEAITRRERDELHRELVKLAHRNAEQELRHMRDATADMVDEMWGTYQIVDGAYNFAIAKVDKLLDKMSKMRERHRAEIEHTRDATGEMVRELWNAYEIAYAVSCDAREQCYEQQERLDNTRKALRKTNDWLQGALASCEHYRRKAKRWKRRAKGRG